MIAGVDGCRGGWLVALGDGWPCTRPVTLIVCKDFHAVLVATASCDAVVVDIPIGLPEGPVGRACDVAAKRILGAAHVRVFLAPPRSALPSATPREFQAAYRAVRGRGAAIPLWGIAAKIREVDAEMHPAQQRRVLEFHPELAWMRLAGAVLPPKHTAAGLARRQRLLRPAIPSLGARPPEDVRRHARRDDILDALVGLRVAADVVTGRGRRLPPGRPPVDHRGLRMEIWY